MTGPNLPVNIDSAYADDALDASKKIHQQHHDSIHAVVNMLDKDATPADGQLLVWSAASGTYVPQSVAASGGAPVDGSYVTMSSVTGLSAESVLGTSVLMQGTSSAKPGAPFVAGRCYFETDTGLLKRDNGAAWTTIAVGTGYGAASDLAEVAAVENAGNSLLVAPANHVHAHGSGYLPDAHHAQIHGSGDHSVAYASQLAGMRLLTGPTTYTVVVSDGIIVCDATAGLVTINLPPISTVTSPPVAGSVGSQKMFFRLDSSAHDVKLVPNGTDTIQTDAHLAGVNQRIVLVADTTGGSPYRWLPVTSHRGPETVVKAADTTKTATTILANDPHLQFNMDAGGTYAVSVRLYYESPTTADIKVALACAPATPTGGWSPTGVSGNAGVNQAVGTGGGLLAYGTSKIFGGGGAGIYCMVLLEAIVNAGTTGFFQVQWAQGTSDAGNTIVHTGSNLSYVRL